MRSCGTFPLSLNVNDECVPSEGSLLLWISAGNSDSMDERLQTGCCGVQDGQCLAQRRSLGRVWSEVLRLLPSKVGSVDL